MSIVGIEPLTPSNSELYASETGTLGKDDFLTLLVAQLQNQDPLKPMDGTDFTAQLAQFSSLEQLENVNSNLETLHLYESSMNNAQAVGFIGKTITALGNSIFVTNGVSEDMHFELTGDAKTVFINIYDASGSFIKGMEEGALNAGEQSFGWDGTDNEGDKVPDGAYMFEVLAVDVNDEMVETSTFTSGRVTGVNYVGGIAYLLLGNHEVAMGNVIKVMEGEY